MIRIITLFALCIAFLAPQGLPPVEGACEELGCLWMSYADDDIDGESYSLPAVVTDNVTIDIVDDYNFDGDCDCQQTTKTCVDGENCTASTTFSLTVNSTTHSITWQGLPDGFQHCADSDAEESVDYEMNVNACGGHSKKKIVLNSGQCPGGITVATFYLHLRCFECADYDADCE